MDTFFVKLAPTLLALFLLNTGVHAQQPTPSPEQAPRVFSVLDRNGDNQLSQDEAQGGLRESFALIDSNGNGGIDLDELTRFLEIAARGNGDPVPQPRVGFEILNFISQDEIIVWVSRELAAEEFNGIELPQGWGKNQPREGDANSSRFLRSPDAEVDGPLTEQELFGSTWMHNATVIENNIPMDPDGLLIGNRIAKYHELTYLSGRTVYLLVSPENQYFIRVSRDLNRASEDPTVPQDWQLIEVALKEDLVMQLPNPTLNIRGDNEDSFQGPLDPALFGVGGPGQSNNGLYNTVTPFEHGNAQRTHLYQADFGGSLNNPERNVVSTRLFEGMVPSPYNIVTRDENELYVFGGTAGEDEFSVGPFVAKYDTTHGSVIWSVLLRNMRELGEFMWPGVVTAHGNGFVYAVGGSHIWKLDSDTGDVILEAQLPAPEGAEVEDIAYNGFTVLEDGTIVAKCIGRPEGCESQGTLAFTECAGEQPPSLLVAIEPDTLEVLSQYQMSESSGGRITASIFNQTQYLYVPGVENILRFSWEESQLNLDTNWEVADYVKPGQTPASAPVVMGDWLVFQTNYSVATAPLSVWAISQEDSSNRLSIDPFGIGLNNRSTIPSALTVDPENMRIFAMDFLAQKVGAIDLVNGAELQLRWIVDQMTLSHTSLVGIKDERVLAATSIVDFLPGPGGAFSYDERVVWRSADTGDLLAQSDLLGPMAQGVPIAPGFSGVWYYLGLDGTIQELKPNHEELERVGFEIQQIVSPTEIITWTNREITLEEFEALELPEGWRANPPTEFEPDEGGPISSPDSEKDGEYTYGDFFGFEWLHNATVVEFGISVDSEGLLSGAYVSKNQEVTYYGGRTIHVLISPEGEHYIRLIRDAFREKEEPSLPSGWLKTEYVISEDLTIRFPNPTLAIFADNGDSFQGPLTPAELGLEEVDDSSEIFVTEGGTEFVRTPESRFTNLPDWPYAYKYVEIDGLRQAYAEAGPADGPVVLLLHGQPSWSYLYRKMMPVLAEAGYRVIAMDHLGCGRSDKPIDIDYYSYLGHCDRLEEFIQILELRDINLFGQDWGSLIGLRVAGMNPDWFASITIGNGDLIREPAGVQLFPEVENPDEILNIDSIYGFIPDQQGPFLDGCELLFPFERGYDTFHPWAEFAMKSSNFIASEMLEALTWIPLSEAEEAAYDAPFPSRTHMAGIRVFPSLINEIPGTTDEAWSGLGSFEKPFLTIWGGNDPSTLGSCEMAEYLIENIPGAAGQSHDRLPQASHFLQEDEGELIATRLVEFYTANGIEADPVIKDLGFELFEARSPNEIIVWFSDQITEEEFNAIELPTGWFKSQIREGTTTSDRFLRSPGANEEGPLTEAELFGHTWVQNAVLIESGIEMDDQGILQAARVAKYHELTYAAGETVRVLISPEEEYYVLVGRDANRTQEDPTIPSNWQLIESVTREDLVIQLPNPTLNIRADNEDSFQGPVSAEALGLRVEDNKPPIELSPNLCNDPSNISLLVDLLNNDGDNGGPGFGDANFGTIQRMLSAPTEGPFYMVNLIRFRERAVYPDGRETNLTGREANDLYNAAPFIEAIGGRIVFTGDVTGTTFGEDGAWDQIAIVEYPCPLAFLAMIVHPEFLETEIHKEAGLEESIVMVTYLQTSEDLPAISDAGFYTVDVYQVGNQATYTDNQGEPDRTGAEALALFESGIEKARLDQGIGISARLRVDGVVVGDGRDFDEVWVHAVPGADAYESFLSNPDVVEAIRHRDAALTDGYGMIVGEAFSDFPEVSDPPENEVIEHRELQVGSFVFNARIAGPENEDLVLLLHGFPETSLAWRAQLPALAEAGYFAVAPDLRGISPGAQPTDVEDYRMHLIVKDILGMADTLGRERFHVIGHDFGAIAAWEVAATAPERVKTLTAFAVPHPDAFIEEARDSSSCQYEASAYFESLTPAGSEQAFLANDGAALRILFPGLPGDVVNEYIEELSTGDTMRAAVDWYRANTIGRELSLLNYPYGDISVDTLMIWGDADGAVCREPVEATGAFVTGEYRLEILEGVDHWVPERVPELVNPWILEHLAGQSDGEVDETPKILMTESGVEFVRTPESRFTNLPDWPYEYKYVEIDGLRQAYAEAGPEDGPVVLLLHGQPSWSYLYRKMMPVLAEAGYRAIAMDHLGCGRSDKPIDIDAYTYLGHNDRLEKFIQALELEDINLFVQDWGSLIGLRVAGLNPDWFASIGVGNGALPIYPAGEEVFPPIENPHEIIDLAPFYDQIPDQQVPFYNGCERLFGGQDNSYFGNWMEFAMKSSQFVPSGTVEAQTWFPISEEVEAAYDAPFPSRIYMAGIRKFPSLVNEVPGTTLGAWAGLSAFEKPFITIWASNDAGQMGGCEAAQVFIDNVPGAEGQPHVRIPESSHFLQEDQGEEIAMRLVDFYETNGIEGNNEKAGFEIHQVVSMNEIITWKSTGMTQEEFDAIDLPQGWFKNQPRIGLADGGSFARSPDAIEDGPLTVATHFGHEWEHVATIIETNITMDDQELLSGNLISKHHTIRFNAGSILSFLVSPEGETYVLVSRDNGRASDTFGVPNGWQILEYMAPEELILSLPNPTTNIRTENEDSYQGPVSAESLLLSPELWLATNGLPQDSSLSLDLNGDGVNLLMAYALGLDPNQLYNGSVLNPTVGEAHVFSVSFKAIRTDIVYQVEVSADLKEWTTQGVQVSEPGPDGLTTVSVEMSGPNRFLRLTVKPAPIEE